MRTLEWAFESVENLQNYVEGCINDFEAGLSTKEELSGQIAGLLIEMGKRRPMPGVAKLSMANGVKPQFRKNKSMSKQGKKGI